MAANAVNLSLDKASVTPADVDLMLGGDLLNQLITADFVARDWIPLFWVSIVPVPLW